jgi:DNA-nicking Smr family endonuclease
MSRRRDLKPDEARLWNKVARTTRAYRALTTEISQPSDPLPTKETQIKATVQKPAPPMPHLALKRAQAKQVPVVAPATPQKPLDHPIADASGHRKIRRGKLDIDGSIDLHGFRQAQAQVELTGFLVRMRMAGARCVLVVTGKGRIAQEGDDYLMPQPGVIRRRLPDWLAGPEIRQHVSGFASAHPKHGGSGAYYVLLKGRSGD